MPVGWHRQKPMDRNGRKNAGDFVLMLPCTEIARKSCEISPWQNSETHFFVTGRLEDADVYRPAGTYTVYCVDTVKLAPQTCRSLWRARRSATGRSTSGLSMLQQQNFSRSRSVVWAQSRHLTVLLGNKDLCPLPCFQRESYVRWRTLGFNKTENTQQND